MNQYYELDPESGSQYLGPEEIIKIIITNFENYLFDEDSAVNETKMRLESLRELGASQELIDSYENSNPIKCTIYNDDRTHCLSFDINNDQSLFIMPERATLDDQGLEPSVNKLAELLKYTVNIEE